MATKYTVRFYKGDYGTRQADANRDRAVAYVEQHFNGGSPQGNYALVIVGSNASEKSKSWAADYASRVSKQLKVKLYGKDGVLPGGFNGRGDGNIKQTAMPAVLLEPLFAVNPEHAAAIRTESVRQQLAGILADSIRAAFPKGGLIAFSVGHKYKQSNPHDRGVAVVGGGTEADYAEDVLLRAKRLLES